MREAIAAQDGGSPLSPDVAGVVGAGLGVDASPVRVHTDAKAAAATSHLGVRAFTWGSHVYLANGESPQDVALLAHEVTHAVQQSAGPAVQLFGGPTSGGYGALEREAQSAGSVVAAGGGTTVVGRTSGARIQGAWGWISKAVSFVGDVAGALKDKVLGFVKDKAKSIPGYDLLGVALGRDPITQTPVERTAINLVRGVVGLVPGGAALFANLEQAKVIQRASEWLEVEIGKLGLTWTYIRQLFSAAWDALSISDFASPGTAWDKLKNIFGPPLSRLGAFAVAAGRKVLEFVFEGALALAGSAGQEILAIFRRIGSVFNLIVSDPVKFLSNLLGAIKGGVGKFKDNILAHLKTGLFEWLMGAMQGVLTLPSKWDFGGILSVILEILGLTWSTLRGILVKVMGEPAVAVIEKVFDFVVTAVTKGLPAVWEKIKEFASDLADTVINGIRDWIVKSVVGAAITKLVTMFNPVGAIIQGVITIYNTVMFFIERAKQIARLVNSIVDSVENIAKGNLSAAVSYVEKTMANTLPVIIGFLARLAGLGKVTDYVRDIIAKVKATISNALEKVALWVKDKAKAMIAGRGAKESAVGQKPPADKSEALRQRAATELQKKAGAGISMEDLASAVRGLAATLQADGLQRLELGPADDEGVAVISAQASPFAPLARFIPKGTVPKGTSVTAIVEVTFSDVIHIPGRRLEPVGPPPAARLTQLGGGAVLMQPAGKAAIGLDPEREARTVRSAHWNTAPMSLNEHGNSSHAEHQMVAWLESAEMRSRWPNIQSISLNIRSLSPCAACADELRLLLSEIGVARGKFVSGSGGATLSWSRLYLGIRKLGGDNRTTNQNIVQLGGAGWTLHAPADARPTDEGVNREKAKGMIDSRPPK